MQIDGLFIPSLTDMPTEYVWQSDGSSQYEFIRGHIRGLIEPVCLPRDMWMYVHEEGKLLGLPVNRRANRIINRLNPYWAVADVIVGAVLIVGRLDEFGSHLRLSSEQRDTLSTYLTVAQPTRRKQ